MRRVDRQIWPEGLFIGLEFVLTVLHNIDSVIRVFPNPEHAFIALVAFQLFVLAAYVALRLGFHVHETRHAFSSLGTRLLNVPQLIPIERDDFYSIFKTHVRRASKAVSISNLDKRPPNLVRRSQEAEYYDQRNIRKLVESIRPVQVRRLERLSIEKIDWIQSFLTTFQGCDNFSLAALPLREDYVKSIAVSVQVIDEDTTFLVDVARSESPHMSRDLLIVSRPFSERWQRYYDDVLWARSIVIMQNGEIVNDQWQQRIPR
jgi:hypothetical protein